MSTPASKRPLSSSSTPSPFENKKLRDYSPGVTEYSYMHTSTPYNTGTMSDSPTQPSVPQGPYVQSQPASLPFQHMFFQQPSQFTGYPPASGSMSISESDVDRIAKAVRGLLLEDINTAVERQIAPLVDRVSKLEAENDVLRLQLDDLEQYGRRPLVRFSGFPESKDEVTTDLLLQAARESSVDLIPEDLERSHRVGRPTSGKPRIIIARLRSTEAKFKLLKSSSGFRATSKFKHISVNEDLTQYRSKLSFFARRLVKEGKILKTWTTNGKISVLDKNSKVFNIRRESDLIQLGHILTT
ncbi:hypothetical protein KP79_PYT26248 [Mizuhopecten yessoensis]|uniref:Uncharacterized protein n=1 Tax=Mizuhopecten yessoensis TaxID=6573 RepID=A0A210QBZ7_MIZYE|nr:hypothetical protein KP79_PYT26248 [Mizuhopecten yessoensis]